MIKKKKSDFNPSETNNQGMKGVKFFPLITAKDGAPNFALRVFEVKSGGHSPRHSHKWEHEIYILSGSGFAVTGKGDLAIEKDDCLMIEPLEEHQIKAGEQGISFICVVPNEGQPD